MELQEIESLKISYHQSCSNTSNDSIKQYRGKISKEKGNQFLNLLIENDLNPEIVVSALLECCNSIQTSLISNIFLFSTGLILKNQFKSSESATKFVYMLKSKIPEYADLKFCYRMIIKSFEKAIKLEEEKKIVSHRLLSFIPPFYNKLISKNEDIELQEGVVNSKQLVCEFLQKIISEKVNGFVFDALIEMFSEISLSESQYMTFSNPFSSLLIFKK
jgi:hypothetical protein